MTYKIPIKDGKVDWLDLGYDVYEDFLDNQQEEYRQLKALYNHALEEAAKRIENVVGETATNLAEDIRALREPEQ